MDNRKIQRINSDILRVLSIAVQQKIQNPMLAGIHVLNVETSADLSESKVFVSVSGDLAEQQAILGELSSAGGFLRNEIAQTIKMKQAPRLRFILDKGKANAERVEELLAKITQGQGINNK